MEGLLSAISNVDDKQRARNIISTQYSELILDPDEHPVVFDKNGVLRFKEDWFMASLQRNGVLCLNRLAVAVATGKLSEEMQRKVIKSMGYSVPSYFGLSFVQKWVREVTGTSEEFKEANFH